MAKKEILSRFNLKDYNKELEIILEKKDFSSQVKNLFLSMFYKIEIGCKDYFIVKQESLTKESLMETLLYIIQENCEKIELIKPDNEALNVKKFEVFPEEKKILCYQNEAELFHSILEMGENNFLIFDEEETIKQSFQTMLKEGGNLDLKEIITNFDGWSWNNNMDNTDEIDYYLLYEILKILMGNNFMYEWKKDRRKDRSYIKEIKEKSSEIYKAICSYCLAKMAKNKDGKKFIADSLKELKNKLQKMEEKDEFLRDLYKEKKNHTDKIKIIDKILNDNLLLKNEFIKRNKNNSEDNKIFSISDLVEIIQKERADIISKIELINKTLEPKNYLKIMQVLQENISIIESSEYKKISDKILQQKMLDIILIFIENIKKKIANIDSKKEIIEYIYKFRYFTYLPFLKEDNLYELKDLQEIQEQLTKLENKIITKACKLKALIIVNQDINYNSRIIRKILDTKIVDLSKIFLLFLKQKEEIEIEIYDTEVLDRVETIKKEKEKDFNIKFKKKIKLFI